MNVFSTHPHLAEAFAPYAVDSNAAEKEVTKCRGRLAAKSANYTPMMCQIFWHALCRPLPTAAAAAAGRRGMPSEGVTGNATPWLPHQCDAHL